MNTEFTLIEDEAAGETYILDADDNEVDLLPIAHGIGEQGLLTSKTRIIQAIMDTGSVDPVVLAKNIRKCLHDDHERLERETQ